MGGRYPVSYREGANGSQGGLSKPGAPERTLSGAADVAAFALGVRALVAEAAGAAIPAIPGGPLAEGAIIAALIAAILGRAYQLYGDRFAFPDFSPWMPHFNLPRVSWPVSVTWPEWLWRGVNLPTSVPDKPQGDGWFEDCSWVVGSGVSVYDGSCPCGEWIGHMTPNQDPEFQATFKSYRDGPIERALRVYSRYVGGLDPVPPIVWDYEKAPALVDAPVSDWDDRRPWVQPVDPFALPIAKPWPLAEPVSPSRSRARPVGVPVGWAFSPSPARVAARPDEERKVSGPWVGGYPPVSLPGRGTVEPVGDVIGSAPVTNIPGLRQAFDEVVVDKSGRLEKPVSFPWVPAIPGVPGVTIVNDARRQDVVARSDVLARADLGRRERKVMVTHTAHSTAAAIVGEATEALDFLGDVWDALPRRAQESRDTTFRKYRGADGRWHTAQKVDARGRPITHPYPWRMMQDILNHYDEVDWGKAAENFAADQVKDNVIGGMHHAANRGFFRANPHMPFGPGAWTIM